MPKRKAQALEGRRAPVFSVRVSEDERAALERRMLCGGPRALGPWLLWAALGAAERARPGGGIAAVVPPSARRRGNTVVDGRRRGTTAGAGSTARDPLEGVIPKHKRVILDLCAGSGAWSEPYKRAGYKVIRVTLPAKDVRTFVAPAGRVWGVLCAPPCEEFSLARNGSRKPRDFAKGLECVNACLRIVLQTRPRWWALENPQGKLSIWLGRPRDSFEPCDFGDPWTKRTQVWGDFTPPARGPHVRPARGATSIHRAAADRAKTPPGFARAFFRANP